MKNLLILILLAIVQGVTEFLPISSSGHLSILYELLNIDKATLLLTIILHIATLVALCVYYHKEIYALITHPLSHTNRKIIVSTICTIVVAIPMYKIINIFMSVEYIIFTFGATAILLLIADYVSNTTYDMTNIYHIYDNILDIDISYTQAVVIGIVQGIAVLPGISRSGSTIATALLLRVDKRHTTRYSFLISIPIIIGSGILQVYDIVKYGTTIPYSWYEMMITFVVCMVVGYISIKVCAKVVNSNKLHIFSYYLIVLIIILLVASVIR